MQKRRDYGDFVHEFKRIVPTLDKEEFTGLLCEGICRRPTFRGSHPYKNFRGVR